MRKRIGLAWLLAGAMACTALGAEAAQTLPGQFYLTKNPQYWQYTIDAAGFALEVPAKGEAYVQHDLLGGQWLKISLGVSAPVYGVYAGKAADAKALSAQRDAIVGSWQRLLSNTKVSNDTQITTSNQITADFYEVHGKIADGKTAIIKWVAFRKGGEWVALTFAGTSDDYHGDVRAYWLQMVNTFRWK
ncbi:MAG TPA: hypothetical protein VFK80_00485 [Limnochordia bacterium]|nr:hypothetical protein [Limnochordia bacterium]